MRLIAAFCIPVTVCATLLPTVPAAAQYKGRDTIIELKGVTVYSDHDPGLITGASLMTTDSLTMAHSQLSSISDILMQGTNLYLKNYGPGSLASVSIRGSGSSQTCVSWNGFDLNSPTTGMTDLSLVPAAFFNGITVSSFTGPDVACRSSLGGSIDLKDGPLAFGAGSVSAEAAAGSFGDYAARGSLSLAGKQFNAATKVLYKTSENNFPFRNTTKFGNPVQKQQHAAYLSTAAYQSFSLKITEDEWINLAMWVISADRQIPPSLTMSESKARRTDDNFRSVLRWFSVKKKGSWSARASWLKEDLHFTDVAVDSRIRSGTVAAALERRQDLTQHLRIDAGLLGYHTSARVKYYDGIRHASSAGAFCSVLHSISRRGLKSSLTLKQDVAEGFHIPLVASLGAETRLLGPLFVKGHLSNGYRLPTLNDRYWKPGGNENLQPEKSLSSEAGIFAKTQDGKIFSDSRLSLTFFNSLINDWILWYPVSPDFWSAVNVQQVWSRGLEMNGSGELSLGDWTFGLEGGYAYTRCTNRKKTSETDASIGKQIIYVPEHTVSARLRIGGKNTFFSYFHSFCSARYVLRDNSAFLKEYQHASLSLVRHVKLKMAAFEVQLEVNNIWDSEYQLIQYYPEPGRSFQVSLRFDMTSAFLGKPKNNYL